MGDVLWGSFSAGLCPFAAAQGQSFVCVRFHVTRAAATHPPHGHPGPLHALVLLLLAFSLPLAAQAFDKAEFAARRAKLLEKIPDGIAVVLGGIEHPYPVRFRQSPDFYYLTGLEEPGTVLVLNGVTKNAAVFAVKRPEFGGPSGDAAAARSWRTPQERYGIAVQPMESFFTFLELHRRATRR